MSRPQGPHPPLLNSAGPGSAVARWALRSWVGGIAAVHREPPTVRRFGPQGPHPPLLYSAVRGAAAIGSSSSATFMSGAGFSSGAVGLAWPNRVRGIAAVHREPHYVGSGLWVHQPPVLSWRVRRCGAEDGAHILGHEPRLAVNLDCTGVPVRGGSEGFHQRPWKSLKPPTNLGIAGPATTQPVSIAGFPGGERP